MVVLTFLVLIYLRVSLSFAPDASLAATVAQGVEHKGWDEIDQATVRKMKYSLIVLTSIFQPISQLVFSIWFCHPSYAHNGAFTVCETKDERDDGKDDNNKEAACVCGGKSHVGFLFASVVLFCLLTVAFPYWCVQRITANRPVGSQEDEAHRFNEDGIRVEFDDKMYKRDLKTDEQRKNPFLFLYDGYEQKHRYYKVEMMAAKVALVFFVILFGSPLAPSKFLVALLAVLFAAAALCGSVALSPFIDASADRIDVVSRASFLVVMLLTLIGQVVATKEAASRLGFFSSLTAVVGTSVMAVCMLAYSDRYKAWLKNRTGIFTFSVTVPTAEKDLTPEDALQRWRIRLELKHR